MRSASWGLIVGISVGVVIGLLLSASVLICIWYRKSRAKIGNNSSRRTSTIPIRTNGVDSCSVLSDSTIGQDSPKLYERSGIPMWLEGIRGKNKIAMSGVPKYSYRDLQKGTSNFTTVIGEGAFGPVYKAHMPTGETVAVKVLAASSKQGEKEFQTEVLLLGRLHHRNLVNLVGYCAEKGEHMLIYVYMPNGSLASHLYSENHEALDWSSRINIALDVAKGIEYLHDGVVPPIVHRDIKSSNILLDQSMRARVSDFGLSREELLTAQASGIRGTFGYVDPEYISTKTFNKKSDVYSFGVLLFELITGRNPQQGLMEYVELAAISAEGSVGWEEIVDSHLEGKCSTQELNELAALAYKCVNKISRKRPSMKEIVQELSLLGKEKHVKSPHKKDSSPTTIDEEISESESAEVRISISD